MKMSVGDWLGRAFRFFAMVVLVAVPTLSSAQSLAISPTKLEVIAPGNQATMVIKAAGAQISSIQIRVFAWTEGTDPSKLRNTKNVAVSPPLRN